MRSLPLLYNGPRQARWHLILAHGAGQGMESPFMAAFAEGLAIRGRSDASLRVVRFEFPYMAATRRENKRKPPDKEALLLETWRAVISRVEQDGHSRNRVVIGGKSLGGRIASMVADEQHVAGLVCLGYPFHPPGKPERLRTLHLEAIGTPTLICQGTRDTFGNRDDVVGYRLAPAIRFHWLEDGDHSFKPRKASGRTEKANWDFAMDAIAEFIRGLA